MAKALFLVTLLTVVVGVGELRKSRAVNKEREENVHFMGRGRTGMWVADVDTSGKLRKSGSRIRIVALETGNGVFGE